MIWAIAGLFLVCVYLLIENIKLKKELGRNHPFIQNKYDEAKKIEGLWYTAKRHSKNYMKFFNLSDESLKLMSNNSYFYQLFETKIDNFVCHIYIQKVHTIEYENILAMQWSGDKGDKWATILMAKLYGENDSDYQTECGMGTSEFNVLDEEYHKKLLYEIRISELELLAKNKKGE